MSRDVKPVVSKEETFDRLDMRVGRVVAVEVEADALKPSYRIEADFGKFGTRITVARLTNHMPEALIGQFIVGVLNFEPRLVGETVSEFLLLGPQYPKADSGEASFLVPAVDVKIGGKIF